jgi:hypothetical protein
VSQQRQNKIQLLPTNDANASNAPIHVIKKVHSQHIFTPSNYGIAKHTA